MKIDNDKVVALDYTLVVDGQVADKSREGEPLRFIFGMGYLLPKFEENVKGLEEGDSFEFTLSAKEGYGEADPNCIIDLPMEAFAGLEGEQRAQILVEGNVIPLSNGSGQVLQGRILSIGETSVKIDLNHPMAGKVLNFTGKVVSVREATEKEMTEGLYGERASGGCNCSQGCSSCSGDCEGGCGGGCN